MEVSSKLVFGVKLGIEGRRSGDVRREKMCVILTVKALGECEVTSK